MSRICVRERDVLPNFLNLRHDSCSLSPRLLEFEAGAFDPGVLERTFLRCPSFPASLRPAIRMKIAFVVNDVQTELAPYTTTRLAMSAANLGHQSFVFGVGDFLCATDGSIHARARTPRAKSYKSL